MGRPLRPTSADVVYHVLNQANARRALFEDEGDYAAFECNQRGQGRIVFGRIELRRWRLEDRPHISAG